ncbi:MAG: class I SAM-dependent methyltransferase [Micropruina sp.]
MRTGTDVRYLREWLEQQTVAGLLDVADPALDAADRRFSVPADHVPVLVDTDDLAYFPPFLNAICAAATQLPVVVDAFHTGAGVPWSSYGPEMRIGQAEGNRALFLTVLGQHWLPSIPDVHRALLAGGRVADIGAGEGWSSVGIALAYPDARVDAFDIDAESVRAANQHAAGYHLADRVRSHLLDGSRIDRPGAYDLVVAFECVHDMSDPVAVLAEMRELCAPGGAVIVMDERAPETFTGAGDPVEQLLYGYSVMICLPDGRSHPNSAATGTVLRPAMLREYASRAGFADVDILPIEHDIFRFYRLHG